MSKINLKDEIGGETKIEIGLVLVFIGMMTASLIWVGRIDAQVTRVREDQREYKQDVKEINDKLGTIEKQITIISKERE